MFLCAYEYMLSGVYVYYSATDTTVSIAHELLIIFLCSTGHKIHPIQIQPIPVLHDFPINFWQIQLFTAHLERARADL